GSIRERRLPKKSQVEDNPVIVEDGGGMDSEEIDGGVNGAGLQGEPDLADYELRVVRRRRMGWRWRRRGRVFDQ
ncbi:cell division control protein 45-like protein, partial [Sesbania bispinosa]